MATVTLTDLFSNLNGWQGDLLSAGNGTTVTKTTATVFSYVFGAGHQFAGYTVTIRGTGFAYSGTTPTGGDMAKLVITDASGLTVLTVAGLAPNTLASDLSLFAAYSFGWTDPNGGGSGPQVKNTWSQLLSGNDVINGTAGDDRRGLPGMNHGDDVFNMGDGDDWVGGSMGNDTINGGNDWDELSFSETNYNEGMSMSQGIIVDVTAGTVIDAWGFTDEVNGIEIYEGSSFNDLFIGGTSNDYFRGLRGRDTFDGGLDTSDHGDGGDQVRYENDAWLGGNLGIVADLSTSVVGGNIFGTIKDGFGNIDQTINIDSVQGTRYDDIFVGSSLQNVFLGGEGVDKYNGGAGEDVLWFFWKFTNADQTGAIVDLSRATGQIRDDGFGNVETAVSIEDVVGSDFNDSIKGSAGTNILEGFYGADTLTGAGGNDEFKYFWRPEAGETDTITDFRATGAANRDQMQFWVSNWGVSNVLTLVNGTAATQAVSTFIFNAATQVLSWDEDGTGGIGAIDVALLQGVTALTAANFDLL